MNPKQQRREFIYIISLRHDPTGYIKVGKCRGAPRDRFRHKRFHRLVTPFGYKKHLVDPGNIRVLAKLSTAKPLNFLLLEQRFHRTHREWARCGEWYPHERLPQILKWFEKALQTDR